MYTNTYIYISTTHIYIYIYVCDNFINQQCRQWTLLDISNKSPSCLKHQDQNYEVISSVVRQKPPETIEIPRSQVSCNLRKGAQRSSTMSTISTWGDAKIEDVKRQNWSLPVRVPSKLAACMSRWTYITLSTKPFPHASAATTKGMRGAIRLLFLTGHLYLIICCVVRWWESKTKHHHNDTCLFAEA